MSVATRSAVVSLRGLDELWFQIAGTICNLRCHHCFISCSPHNKSFDLIPKEDVFQALEASRGLGVKEYYFTGGEPFIHPDMVEILEATLGVGPATVLTNGTLLKQAAVERLARAERASLYSLEFRVSIDGFSPETNDPIRGEGTFSRAIRGVSLLVEEGFLPIVTVAQTWEDDRAVEVFERFVEVLKAAGYDKPRIKIIPTLRLGAEVERHRGYHDYERVAPEMLEGFDTGTLICSHSRIVTSKGVYVCPILIDSPEARLGADLRGATEPFALAHGACYTCYLGGAICTNTGAGTGNVS